MLRKDARVDDCGKDRRKIRSQMLLFWELFKWHFYEHAKQISEPGPAWPERRCEPSARLPFFGISKFNRSLWVYFPRSLSLSVGLIFSLAPNVPYIIYDNGYPPQMGVPVWDTVAICGKFSSRTGLGESSTSDKRIWFYYNQNWHVGVITIKYYTVLLHTHIKSRVAHTYMK